MTVKKYGSNKQNKKIKKALSPCILEKHFDSYINTAKMKSNNISFDCQMSNYSPRVSLMFLYKLMASVSFMNSLTTSPWSFSTTSTSSGLAMRLTISKRTCRRKRTDVSNLWLPSTHSSGSMSCLIHAHVMYNKTSTVCSGKQKHDQIK